MGLMQIGFLWDSFFNLSLLRQGFTIVGGDLNFSLGNSKVWRHYTIFYPLTNYFLRNLDDCGLFGVAPVKLRLAWRNKRVDPDRISKRLDRFLMSEDFLNDSMRLNNRLIQEGIPITIKL
jgi:hypothetical protein